MQRSSGRLTACLVLAAVLGLSGGARAQFRYGANPAAGYAYDRTQAVAGCAPDRAPFRYSPNAAGYGPYVYQDPTNGFLTGAADVMNAAGQYEIDHQKANLTREQVQSAHTDNRRKTFDELRYEKANTPTLWENMSASQYEQLQQARNLPQQTDIWEGTVFNVLLDDIRQIQVATGLHGAIIPLDPDTVKHLSLSVGKTTASSTMLANGGKLKWPPELDDDRFDADRKEVDKLYQQAIQEAGGSDGLGGRTMRSLAAAIDQLQNAIDGAINDMTPSDNIRARVYTNKVSASAKLLRDPNVAKQLNGDWAPRGSTVAEVIDNMNRNGQRFAPAAPDARPSYSSFYLSLLEYDLSLARLVGPLPVARNLSLPGSQPSPGFRP